ncbi:hypothetical protein MJO29_015243, partial [Puccinia striiformis f. sp. tritici]
RRDIPHGLKLTRTAAGIAAEARSPTGAIPGPRLVDRQLGLPNLTRLSASSTRCEAGSDPSPSSPLPPHALGCHHERQVEKEACSSFETMIDTPVPEHLPRTLTSEQGSRFETRPQHGTCWTSGRDDSVHPRPITQPPPSHVPPLIVAHPYVE